MIHLYLILNGIKNRINLNKYKYYESVCEKKIT